MKRDIASGKLDDVLREVQADIKVEADPPSLDYGVTSS
jgi:hypothetical protein